MAGFTFRTRAMKAMVRVITPRLCAPALKIWLLLISNYCLMASLILKQQNTMVRVLSSTNKVTCTSLLATVAKETFTHKALTMMLAKFTVSIAMALSLNQTRFITIKQLTKVFIHMDTVTLKVWRCTQKRELFGAMNMARGAAMKST